MPWNNDRKPGEALRRFRDRLLNDVPQDTNQAPPQDSYPEGPVPETTPGNALQAEGGLMPWGFDTFWGGMQDIFNMIPEIKDEYETRTAPVTEDYQQKMNDLLNILENTYAQGNEAMGNAGETFGEARGAVANPVLNFNVTGGKGGNAALPIYNNRLARTLADIGQGYIQQGQGYGNLGSQQGATQGGLMGQLFEDMINQISGGVNLSGQQLAQFWDWYNQIAQLLVNPAMEGFWQLLINPGGESTYVHGSDPDKSSFGVGLGVGPLSIGGSW